MEEAGLPTPRHYKITRREDVQAAAEHVGFPSVIKPISAAGSLGVIRVNDEFAFYLFTGIRICAFSNPSH